MNLATDPEFGGLSDSGPLIHIRSDKFLAQAPQILMAHLSAFRDRTYEIGELSNGTMAGKKEFDRTHKKVGVTLKSEQQLELQPMVRVKGKMGFQGDRKQAILVELPTTPEKMRKCLDTAFSRC